MEFSHKGNDYKVARLNAREQFHIVRRLAPIFGSMAALVERGKDSQPLDAITEMGKAIASLRDEDADYVIFGLLKAVQRKMESGLGFGPVTTGTTLMYEDIDLATMMTMAWHALSFNLSGFFDALPVGLKEALQKANGQLPG